MLHWYSEMEKKRYWDLLKNSLEIMHFDNQVLMIIEKEKNDKSFVFGYFGNFCKHFREYLE